MFPSGDKLLRIKLGRLWILISRYKNDSVRWEIEFIVWSKDNEDKNEGLF